MAAINSELVRHFDLGQAFSLSQTAESLAEPDRNGTELKKAAKPELGSVYYADRMQDLTLNVVHKPN